MDMPNIHLDADGTEVDDEDYFQTLEPNTELIAVFSGEQWIDVSVDFCLFFLLWLLYFGRAALFLTKILCTLAVKRQFDM